MKIGLLFNRARGYGRRFCLGVAAWAEARDDWQLEMIPPDASTASLAKYDGIIAHILDECMQDLFTGLKAKIVADFYRTGHEGFAQAMPDHSAIGALAANHFIERGFSSFAFCGYDGILFSDARRNGFAKNLSGRSFAISEYRAPKKLYGRFGEHVILNEELTSRPVDEVQLAKWLKSLPHGTAVFCAHDLRAIQAPATAKRCGLEIPRDLAILGVDNDILACSFVKPRLSSIDNNGFGCGQAAAKCLESLFSGEANSRTLALVPPLGIVARQSTARFCYPSAEVNEALEFIRANISRNLTASMFFSHIGLAHTSLDKKFKNEVGRTVHAELARIRIEEAKRLLSATNLPLADIASRYGFATRKYFVKVFLSATGCDPSTWRSYRGEIAKSSSGDAGGNPDKIVRRGVFA